MADRRKHLLEVRHPVFLPLWRRVVFTVAICAWALFELANGRTIWGLMFGAAGVVLIYKFFVIFDPSEYQEPPDA